MSYTSRGLDGQGVAGTLASLKVALEDMTPARWEWHVEQDEATRVADEAYWNKVENEWIAYKINCGDLNFPQMRQGFDLYNKYAPKKHALEWKAITG
jgi:hypothetical protein|tara:strand:+ start:1047 stop:1337 length:291 start_codon:yes stop_codon:yes gene_type:complete